MAVNGTQTMTELETFLPQDGSNLNGANKYKIIKVTPNGTDADNIKAWDPFKERKNAHPTTDCDTLTHLLKASLGTGILAMPIAFKNAGLTVGIICTLLVALVCTHCAYVLVKCAHELYRRTRVTAMSFADVGEVAFRNGPPWGRIYAKACRVSIVAGLFAAYFGTCSVYTVIIARNFQQVIEHYSGEPLNLRVYIAALLLPLIILSWVPNLKYLAPISMVANLFMGVGLGITLYYLVWDFTSPADMPQTAPILELPVFFSITIFAMEAIGVVMPLENNMKTPQHFIGICGVLNKGMGGVTLIYILLGIMGYCKYGDETLGSITLNLPTVEIPAQAVQILVALAVYCTYGLQYFVCLEIVWDAVKERFPKNPKLNEYIVRTVLTTTTVLLAIAVPTIGPFIGLIGALCFSLLGLIIPVLIEIVTYWDKGFGAYNWVMVKNVFVLAFGFLALIFGSYTSILDIINVYSPQSIPDNPFIQAAVNATFNMTEGIL